MIWEPRAILGFLQTAGFRTEQWGPALAIVLACSAGDDLYRDVAYPGPSVDHRGLFGLDVIAHPQLAETDLFNPRTNCAAAYTLSTTAQGSWGWAGCPVPPTSSDVFTAAKQAVRLGAKAQTLAESGRGVGLGTQALANARQLAGLSDYVRSQILTGGTPQ